MALRRQAPLLATSVLLLAACDDGTGPPPVTDVTVAAPSETLTWIGQTVQLGATARDAAGEPRSVTFTWSTSDPQVVSVSSDGVATAEGEGQASVTASVPGSTVAGSLTLTVAQEPAQVRVAADPDSVAAGESLQLVAEVADEGGTLLADPRVSWSSGDEAVATVDPGGLLRGVEEGAVTVRASAGAAQGAVDLRVFRADLRLDGDITLSGERRVDTLVVPAGVTVRVAGDLVVDARFAEVAGAVVGDCVGITVRSRGRLRVTGSVANECADRETRYPDLVLAGEEGYHIDSADVRTSGRLVFTDVIGLSLDSLLALPAAAPSSEPRSPRRRERTDTLRKCYIRGSYVPAPAKAGAAGQQGGPGEPGLETVVTCFDETLFLGNVILAGQRGGTGGEGRHDSEVAAEATGGDGGPGGDLVIWADYIDVLSGESFLYSGAAGAGGPATAIGVEGSRDPDVAASAKATGGNGAAPGRIRFIAHTFIQTFDAVLQIVPREGGSGGSASALAAHGLSADEMGGPAQDGGMATATGGEGYSITIPEPFDGVMVSSGSLSTVLASGGDGGAATSGSGDGGDGGSGFPDGARGGIAIARGGNGGHSNAVDLSRKPLGAGGNGGYATWFLGGGGDGLDGCSVEPHVQGGSGGPGGLARGSDGRPGVGSLSSPDPPGGRAVIFGSGGDGGDGDPPGGGGPAGSNDLSVTGPLTNDGSWVPGDPGDPCSEPRTSYRGALRLHDDPGAHDSLVYAAGEEGTEATVTLTGPDAEGEVILEGADGFAPSSLPRLGGLLADGPFELVGSGEIAGIADVTVTAVGTLSDDVLILELTVGAAGELPGGQPVTYRFEGSLQ